MAWRFRRRIKIIPGITLNISGKGISTTIGVRGASINLGKKGAFLNTGIPGTGFYNRTKLGGQKKSKIHNIPFDVEAKEPIFDYEDNIASVDLENATSPTMDVLKSTIFAIREQEESLTKDIIKVGASLTLSSLKLGLNYLPFLGIFSNVIKNTRIDIASQKHTLKQLQAQLKANRNTSINIKFDAASDYIYSKLTESFTQLSKSKKIWDITAKNHIDRATTRSAAAAFVKRKKVTFKMSKLAEINCSQPAMMIENANGGNIYIYPAFVVIFKNKNNFAILDFKDITLDFKAQRFIESEKIPKDTHIVDHTWEKVNANGVKDKRFKNNARIPVVEYGQIWFKTTLGINELYLSSNLESTKAFATSFLKYQQILSKGDYAQFATEAEIDEAEHGNPQNSQPEDSCSMDIEPTEKPTLLYQKVLVTLWKCTKFILKWGFILLIFLIILGIIANLFHK